MPARRCKRRCVMIRGRAEALQEASGDHHSRQKALAPGGVRARTFCLQIAGYAPGGLYRNYFAQTEDSRVRIGLGGPHLLDLVACTVSANSVICSAVSCPAAHDSSHNHCGQARAEQPHLGACLPP